MLTVDGERLASLSTDELQYFQSRFFLVAGTGTVYVDAKLSVIRVRTVGDGFHEQLTLLNHGEQPVDVTVRIDAGADFADLFEVKDALAKKGSYSTAVEDERLVLRYQRERFDRETSDLGRSTRRGRRARTRPSTCSDRAQGGMVAAAATSSSATVMRRRAGDPCSRGGAGAAPARPVAGDLESWVANAPHAGVRLGSAEAHLHPQPRRPRRAAVLAA